MADLISQGMGTNPRRQASWTSSNGLTTTGTLNPLNLTKNDPSIGYMGETQPTPAASPQAPAQPAAQAPVPAPAPAPNLPAPSLNPATMAPYGYDASRNRYNNAPEGAGAGQWNNGQWVGDNTGPASNPVGDARRAAAVATGTPTFTGPEAPIQTGGAEPNPNAQMPTRQDLITRGRWRGGPQVDQTQPDATAEATKMLTQQQPPGAGAQLQPLTPQFGPDGAPDWGQMRPRFVGNGGMQRRLRY